MENRKMGQQIMEMLPTGTIGKYDLSPVFADRALFSSIVRNLSSPYVGKVDLVVSPEALGWIIGSAIAAQLDAGLIIVRKGGHFPYPSDAFLYSASFTDYDNKTKLLQLPVTTDLNAKRLLIADEWIATGAQMNAIQTLLRNFDCTVSGLAAIGVERNAVTQNWIDTGLLQYIFIDEPQP